MNIKLHSSDGFELDGDFHKGTNSKGVIFCHGMTVTRRDEAPFNKSEPDLKKLGFSTLFFDFRARAKSQGDPTKDFTISGEVRDLETAIQFVKNELASQGETLEPKIYLAGASFGGGIASIVAGRNKEKISKLFLVNPLLNFEDEFFRQQNPTPWRTKYFENALERAEKEGYILVGSKQFPVPLKLLQEASEFFPINELQGFDKPVRIVHSDADTIVSYKNALKYFEELNVVNKEFITLHGSDHGFHEEPYTTQVADLIVNFFYS